MLGFEPLAEAEAAAVNPDVRYCMNGLCLLTVTAAGTVTRTVTGIVTCAVRGAVTGPRGGIAPGGVGCWGLGHGLRRRLLPSILM